MPEDQQRQTTAVDHHIGKRIRARRKQMDMSQQKLAAVLGVSFPQIQKYEQGDNRVSASRLYEIACVLKVSMLFFFEGLGGGPQAWEDNDSERAARFLLQTSEGTAIARAFPHIASYRLRQQILELVLCAAEQDDHHDVEE